MNAAVRITLFVLALIGSVLTATAEKLVIKGSNTFGEELAPHLFDEYHKSHADVTFELESKGSATGFAALLAGQCDIASASRPANEDEERLAHSRGIKMDSHTIGFYGVAVIVNDKNPFKDMSDAQVRSAFTGIINKWKALGWADGGQIQSYIRDPISGTYLGFQELAMDRMPYVRTAKTFKSYEEIADTVKADPNGIGYVSMIVAKQPGVRAVSVNGFALTVESVNDGSYPYARQLRLYTDPKRESAGAKEFIRFCQSKEGQQLIETMGNVRRFEKSVDAPRLGGF